MIVHVVIEWLGNSQTVDGAEVHGVYSDRAAAERAAAPLAAAARRPDAVEILEREVMHGDDGH